MVNNESWACAELLGGDACMTRFVPENWEVLRCVGEAECPAGYTLIEHIRYQCLRCPWSTETVETLQHRLKTLQVIVPEKRGGGK